MAREIYLDNNATTPVAPEVLEAMLPFLLEQYGNPSSLHRKGVEAERAVRASRAAIARFFGVGADEIVFTASGTEADNLAIKGVARAMKRRGNHIVTTRVEHPAVLESCRDLEAEGFDVTYLDIDDRGCVAPAAVEAAITENTVLVSIMHVNNELGTIFPIAEIAERVKRVRREILFHSDGVQGLGKLELRLDHVDLYSISGHKIHAPKGTGALVVRQGVNLKPVISGGGQEQKKRSGTENVAGIVALAKAIGLLADSLGEKLSYFAALKNKFVAGMKEVPGVRMNSPEDAVPTTVNVSFAGIPAEVMLHALEAQGIYVSAGAACSSKKTKRSHVLEAAHIPPDVIDSSLRFSFSRYTTLDQIDEALAAIREAVTNIRAVARRG
jgi:cysteine desulfurase